MNNPKSDTKLVIRLLTYISKAQILDPLGYILYRSRVVQGLSLHSYAAQCARIFGLPDKLADRAQYIRYAIFMILSVYS